MGRTPRRAFSVIYLIVIILVIGGLCSFAVDLGRVQLVKTELRRAADAAARAGASALPGDPSRARSLAADYGLLNRADGSAVMIDPVADVEIGRWDGTQRQFQPLSGAALLTADAVRVTVRRTRARGNATPLIFGVLLGVREQDLTATAVATHRPAFNPTGIVGVDSVLMKGGDRIDSYDSTLGNYSNTNRGGDAGVSSNGNVTGIGSSVIHGNVYAGGTVTGTVIGSIATLDEPLSFPPATLPATYTAHGSINLKGGDTYTLPAGVHYCTNLQMQGSAELRVTGPVKLYVKNSVSIDGNTAVALARGARPADLEIYVLSSSPVSLGKNDLFAVIYAPSSPLIMTGNSNLFGSVIAASIEMKGSNTIHYDRSLSTPGASGTIVLVQ